MENDKIFDPNNKNNEIEEQEAETIIESETTEDDYQFTEKGFEPDDK